MGCALALPSASGPAAPPAGPGLDRASPLPPLTVVCSSEALCLAERPPAGLAAPALSARATSKLCQAADHTCHEGTRCSW